MRQVGILAAAGLYALDHHIDRLAEDHESARRLARGIAEIPGLACDHLEFAADRRTNLVYFGVEEGIGTDGTFDAVELTDRLRERGVLAIPLGADRRRVRMVTHLDVSSSDIDVALDALRSTMQET